MLLQFKIRFGFRFCILTDKGYNYVMIIMNTCTTCLEQNDYLYKVIKCRWLIHLSVIIKKMYFNKIFNIILCLYFTPKSSKLKFEPHVLPKLLHPVSCDSMIMAKEFILWTIYGILSKAQ